MVPRSDKSLGGNPSFLRWRWLWFRTSWTSSRKRVCGPMHRRVERSNSGPHLNLSSLRARPSPLFLVSFFLYLYWYRLCAQNTVEDVCCIIVVDRFTRIEKRVFLFRFPPSFFVTFRLPPPPVMRCVYFSSCLVTPLAFSFACSLLWTFFSLIWCPWITFASHA